MLLFLSKSATALWLEASEWALLVFGVALVVGLIGEHKGIKSATWKAREHIFSMLVVIGVAGELIADGGIFAFSGRLQTISDRENSKLNERAAKFEKEAAELRADNLALELKLNEVTNRVFSIDPLHRPIKSITAHVFLDVLGTNEFLETVGQPVPVLLGGDFLIYGGQGRAARLRCVQFEYVPLQRNGKEIGERTYSMTFAWPNADFMNVLTKDWVAGDDVSVEELDKKMTLAFTEAPHVWKRSEIVSGMCTITINGALERRFSVPKYTDESGGTKFLPIKINETK